MALSRNGSDTYSDFFLVGLLDESCSVSIIYFGEYIFTYSNCDITEITLEPFTMLLFGTTKMQYFAR